MTKDTEAKIVVSHIVTKVAHVCGCDDSHPSFEGEVAGVGVQWPVAGFIKLADFWNHVSPSPPNVREQGEARAFGRFRMSYCPWCGKHLPNTWQPKKTDGD